MMVLGGATAQIGRAAAGSSVLSVPRALRYCARHPDARRAVTIHGFYVTAPQLRAWSPTLVGGLFGRVTVRRDLRWTTDPRPYGAILLLAPRRAELYDPFTWIDAQGTLVCSELRLYPHLPGPISVSSPLQSGDGTPMHTVDRFVRHTPPPLAGFRQGELAQTTRGKEALASPSVPPAISAAG
jgi:hypothetical protein